MTQFLMHLPIRRELEHLEDYLCIIKLRFEDMINFNINIELREMLTNASGGNVWEVWQDSSKSIGLRNIHLRLTSYYGSQYGIVSIQSVLGEGTSITIAIPAKKFQGGLTNV